MEEVLFANYNYIHQKQTDYQELYENNLILHKLSIITVFLMIVLYFYKLY